jgi:hypothetical protein
MSPTCIATSSGQRFNVNLSFEIGIHYANCQFEKQPILRPDHNEKQAVLLTLLMFLSKPQSSGSIRYQRPLDFRYASFAARHNAKSAPIVR